MSVANYSSLVDYQLSGLAEQDKAVLQDLQSKMQKILFADMDDGVAKALVLEFLMATILGQVPEKKQPYTISVKTDGRGGYQIEVLPKNRQGEIVWKQLFNS